MEHLLGVGVDRRGGLVEQQQCWLLQDHTRDAEKLTLAEAEIPAIVGHWGVQLLRKLFDEALQADHLQSSPDVVVGEELEWIKVAANFAREQERILRNEA